MNALKIILRLKFLKFAIIDSVKNLVVLFIEFVELKENLIIHSAKQKQFIISQ